MTRTLTALAASCLLGLAPAYAGILPSELRCESAIDPLGVESLRPRLGWQLASNERGQRQTAYQIQVASTPEKLAAGAADIWDSGRVLSAASTQVEYRGKPLAARQQAFWRVRAWDRTGAPSPYSASAKWEMGLLAPSDWKAQWIGFQAGWPGRALYFRNVITLDKPVRQARAFVAGLGYYELYLNGVRVGDHVLDPGWTDYSKRVLYATYDVGRHLRSGANAIGVTVGNGWHPSPKLLLQLEVTFNDGATRTIVTHGGHESPTWLVTSGPIVANSIYDGEIYDARLEKPGWNSPEQLPETGLDRTEGWATVFPADPPGGRLQAQTVEPIRVVESLAPKTMRLLRPGVAVFDTGQNLAGWAQLRVSGKRGDRITLRFAESLYPDGSVNQENLRKAAATDVYILKGGGLEEWEPRFTYHGFRYVQVEGLPAEPSLNDLTIRVVRSSVEPNGHFESSNTLLNRIDRMVRWTEASNLHSVPTDCPQRDERQGWMNDLTVRMEEALYNFRLDHFLPKFLNDVSDTQNAAGAIADTAPFRWGFRPADPVSASYLLLGWMPYQHYADKRAMAEHYAGFKAWTDFLAGAAQDGIVRYGRYGDWCPPKEFLVGAMPTSRDTPSALMSTGYLYYCSKLVSQMAAILGKPQDQARYAQRAAAVARAFHREYWNEQAGGYASNNQGSNAFALWLGLVPSDLQPRVFASLVSAVEAHDRHLTTGNLCTKYLLEVLSDRGRADLAYSIATQTTYPGWGFMLENGATTLWERWEHMTGGQMNSHNHPMMGSVGSWLYKYLAGIRVDERGPGFARFVLSPKVVPGLDWVRASYASPHGPIQSAWRVEDGQFHYDISVPVNTTATVYLPARTLDGILEGGARLDGREGVRWLRNESGGVVVEVGSGDYKFQAKLAAATAARP